MKTVEFPCWTNFGGCHSVDWEIEVNLTDEEYDLLESVIKAQTQEDFCECKELENIFRKVYREVVDTATADALAYDDDIKDKYGNDPNWKADALYYIGVKYPEL